MITPDYFDYKLIEYSGAIIGVAGQMNSIPELNLSVVSLANLGGIAFYRLLHSAFNDYLAKHIIYFICDGK